MTRIVIGVTGASGQVYAKKIIEKVAKMPEMELDIAFTDTGMQVFMDETGGNIEMFRTYPNVKILDNHGYYNRNASGSNAADAMIVVPCTMGTAGRIANGTTSDLISRIAEVQLKERRRLVIVPREIPYSLIHLRNLLTLTEAGAIIAPASPSFYSNPSSLDDLTDQFADRIIAIAGISDINPSDKWMNEWH
ncbi:MAG: UbiX family flavin prenyltransferase [Bacteroidales bacterium]|nr:UbiX family flavin prenyltransferase [Bacteroidales bacterium]